MNGESERKKGGERRGEEDEGHGGFTWLATKNLSLSFLLDLGSISTWICCCGGRGYNLSPWGQPSMVSMVI